jgi:hypothetical protein
MEALRIKKKTIVALLMCSVSLWEQYINNDNAAAIYWVCSALLWYVAREFERLHDRFERVERTFERRANR